MFIFVDYLDDGSPPQRVTIPYELLEPIFLDSKWKNRLNIVDKFPSWIRSVHEYQNWFYWSNRKKDLDTSKVPMNYGVVKEK